MNYRHLYHAGNFADVLKHVVMIALIRSLSKKETPFCVLDTHAGIGLYPLQSNESQKTQEYKTGIANLLADSTKDKPESIQDYLSIVTNCNSAYSDQLTYYPGSPLIAKKCLREQDQLILCELHPTDVITLKKNMSKERNVAIHHTDAYLGMKAFLPPKLKRGLAMIDPPFEETNEFKSITQALKRTLTHWQFGQFMIWYPIKDQKSVAKFQKTISLLKKPTIHISFLLKNKTAQEKLSACGITLINPPWQFEILLKTQILPYLSKVLNAQWKLDNTN